MGTSRSTQEDSSSSGRSLLSRLYQPLRSVKRNLDDFHIRPDEPHRIYSAGDHVYGAVVFVVTKPVRITHLVVALHGYVRVFKRPSDSDDHPFVSGVARDQSPPKGYASLFQDEQVLSGEGRLEVGRYEFKFDLMFPSKGDLPSSIDFERGSISYNVVATLTRPTTISPTMHCDRKVALVERVDVGLLSQPRPRTIFLEPISRIARRKKPPRNERRAPLRETRPDGVSDVDSVSPSLLSDEPAQEPQPITQSALEQADSRSVFSGDSNLSGSTGRSHQQPDTVSQASHPTTVLRRVSIAKLQAVDAKTITTTIELARGGYLPGDTVPVRVSVQHIKRIKSMHGVILTLYRQGRIDPTRPPPSVASTRFSNSSSRLSTAASTVPPEEYYHDQSRSKSGFSGLSLSKKKKPSIYRKDLCQAVAPLLLDPVTLSTSVSVSVKIPDDAFPTIKSVPGDMISFRYHLEVIIDLGGKLEGQLQSNGAPAQFGAFALSGAVGGPDGASGNSAYSSWSTNVVNTENLKREKGVLYYDPEIIVGTLDSTRVRGKMVARRAMFEPHMTPSPAHEDSPSSPRRLPVLGYMNGHHGGEHSSPRLGHGFSSPRPPTLSEEPGSPSGSSRGLPASPPPPPPPPPPPAMLPPPAHTGIPAPVYVPRPNVPDMNTLSEKERVRLQEQVLLPSQPPQGPSEAGPSASAPPEALLEGTESSPGPSAPPLEALDPEAEAEGPSAPPLDEVDIGDGPATPRAGDPNLDKQELERQRLLNEASAPPEFPEDRHHAGGSGSGGAGPSGSGRGSASASNEPSAPVFSEEDEYGAHFSYSGVAGPSSQGHGHGHGSGSEPLPRYER